MQKIAGVTRFLALFAWLLVGVELPAAAANVTFKCATLAPEGSAWMVIMHEIAEEVKTKTAGRVEFKMYPGGIAGDEPDVLRKMRVGQYHAAGFTGVGLGELVSEIRALELPFYFDNLNELHFVRDKFTSYFEQKFLEKGYVLMDWAEPGLVYLLSQRPIETVKDMAGIKMWAWEADPLADALLQTFKVTPVRIALPDVLMGLQTGMLNAIYAPPLAAMSLQWQTKVKYMTGEPVTNSTGAVLLAKAQWDKLSAADQATLKNSMHTKLVKLNETTTRQNKEAIEKFKEQGIQIVGITKAGREEMSAGAARIRADLVGKLYSAEFLKKLEGYVQEFRNKKTKKKK